MTDASKEVQCQICRYVYSAARRSCPECGTVKAPVSVAAISPSAQPVQEQATAAQLQRYRLSRKFHSMNMDEAGPYVQYDDVVALLAALAQPAPAPAAEPHDPRVKGSPSEPVALHDSGVIPAATAVVGETAQLRKFYGVETDADLIRAQAHHIEKMQAKLPPTPSLSPQRVREG